MSDSYDVSPPPPRFSREFISRRLQSLAGFVFLLFLIEHLFTNSQATLFVGDDGKGFIDAVNWIHSLPYLPVLEIVLIALPILVHTWWGIDRMVSAKFNSNSFDPHKSDGSTASLPYSRNKAFTWQRITAVLLILLVALHILYMRFLKQPDAIPFGLFHEYVVKLKLDPGLYTIAPRLNLTLFDQQMIDQASGNLAGQKLPIPPEPVYNRPEYNPDLAGFVRNEETLDLEKRLMAYMKERRLESDEVYALSDNVGAAFLAVLRDTYKSIPMCTIYSIFVLISSFHACNGLWTFAITWGITLSEQSRRLIRLLSNLLMLLLAFFGLACIWGVYWINLRY